MEVPVERIVEKKVIEYVDRYIEREVIREMPVERIIVQEVPVYVDKVVVKTVVQEVTETSIPSLCAPRCCCFSQDLESHALGAWQVFVDRVIEKIVEVPVDRIIEKFIEVSIAMLSIGVRSWSVFEQRSLSLRALRTLALCVGLKSWEDSRFRSTELLRPLLTCRSSESLRR